MAEKIIDIALESTAQAAKTAAEGAKTAAEGALAILNKGITSNETHGSAFFGTAGDFAWTCPEGVGIILVWAAGGTGGGGGGAGSDSGNGSNTRHGAGGGGSGSVAPVSFVCIPVKAGQTYVVYIGAGGVGGKGGTGSGTNVERTNGENGGDGEQTWFGGNAVAWGGAGGRGGTLDAGGGAGWEINYWGFYPLINNYGGGAGNAGETKTSGYRDGGVGGSAVCCAPFSKWSGSGGAGGSAPETPYGNGENGSNGSDGQCGRMFIIW